MNQTKSVCKVVRVEKRVHNIDREFEGHVIEAVCVAQRDFMSRKSRYEKFLEIIVWREPRALRGKQEVRLCYADRGKLQHRPVMFPLKVFEKLLNRALDRGILKIENRRIRVLPVKGAS